MKTATKSVVSTLDGNEAVASAAYRLSEIFSIYPITPSSTMAEYADEWAVARQPNIWGQVPEVVEMQSEGGAAGAVHGVVQGGVLASTFTASQGLLLMIPNMYKIAGELTPCVIHVSARTLATHALSIFGDHSDVMACRPCGWTMLASNSPQEAHDLAAIAHASTLLTRVPVLHFFDGFRTSHEVNTVSRLSDDTLRALIDADALTAFRRRGLTPDHPVLRGTAQNPDVFFQARESINRFYDAVPGITQETMDLFARLTGRSYHLFDYEGHPEADRVIIIMGSGAETAAETAAWLNANGEKTGVVKVHLYRPFSAQGAGRGAAAHRPGHHRPRPHQGARRRGRAAVPRRRRRAARSRAGGLVQAARRPDHHHRRPLRPLVEGIQSRHGSRRLRRARPLRAQEPLHHRHPRRCHRPLAQL